MAKGFNFPILADVRDFLKSTGQVEDALDQVADALDEVAESSDIADNYKDAARAATQSADTQVKGQDKIRRAIDDTGDKVEDTGDQAKKLDRKFSEAWKEVKSGAQKTGDAIGRDVKAGTDKATEGADEFKNEAGQAAKESAASFRGGFDDIADYATDLAAQAFQGFGPAGAAAGIAAALGLGALIGSLEAGAEKATDLKERVIDVADALDEVEGNAAALDWAEQLRDRLTEITNQKRWYEFWQDGPELRLEEWADKAAQFGISMQDITKGMAGDTESWARAQAGLNQAIDQANTYIANGASRYGNILEAANAFKDELEAEKAVYGDAIELQNQLTGALDGLSTAERTAAESVTEYSSAVSSALDKAGESWETYTTDGVVNLAEYNDAIEAQAAATVKFEENLVTASANLSAEALNYIRSMGPEAAPLLQAYIDAPLAEQQRTAANWQKVASAANDGYKSKLDVKTPTQAQLSAAQTYAANNPVRYGFKQDGDLSTLVQRAVAQVPLQTIRVNLEARPVIY